ncbi:MAG: thiamine pyrophosphate-dependent enzyme [Anaerolineales bacterium]|jgi:2-oxoisovalerate dehydrogenase E1 component
MTKIKEETADLSLGIEEILQDYRLAYKSRQASLIGRREVMSGKAKFGIFGDGKEVAQVAAAKAFKKGDFRSGYYRDQTFMFAIGETSIQQFFAQLFAHADVEAEPSTAGRAMNSHFATRSVDPNGSWKNLTKMYNTSADVSPTGSQMPRLVGLGYASRLYRELEELSGLKEFSNHGNEVAFGMIGNATTAEGMFWEAVNAIGVLKAPVVLSIWDDDYGISVPNEYQMVKASISELLKGFQREPGTDDGYDIYVVKGWDYPSLVRTYLEATRITREEQVPSIIHVIEVTQPQGHSTSGSQERYKSKERLQWEEDRDCIARFRQHILEQGLVSEEELIEMEREDQDTVEEIRKTAWEAYITPIRQERQEVADMITEIATSASKSDELNEIKTRLMNILNPLRRDIMAAVEEALIAVRNEEIPAKYTLMDWKIEQEEVNEERYSSHLYSQTPQSALKVPEIKAVYSESSPTVYGFEVLNACFDAALARDPRVVAFGEDVGKLGDVNQGFKGMQAKYGELRVSDTGIRETTIIGQAIGMAMRGLRPIAEIQYLDYLLYGLQITSDDLATLRWRTRGGQKAPVIIRTRGHRLEGIWHSGSLLAGIINLVRGIHVLVPRNMTQAAGFYNTMLQSDDPALIIEVLNGYRLKERIPDNIGEFSIPLGIPEVIREGSDLTIVTYGALCRISLEAAKLLSQVGIEVEIVDVRTLLPFDLNGIILDSLKKTNRIVFLDEDVPGGTTAYMLQEVIEKQGGYYWLDSEPRTLSSKPHRPAYGSDGDYFSKPNVEQIFESVYDLMNEADPETYPIFYR